MAFDVYLGFRVPNLLARRYKRLVEHSNHRGRGLPDLYRMALEDWCEAQEQELNLPSLPEEETAPGVQTPTPVSYLKPAHESIVLNDEKPRIARRKSHN